MPKLILKFKEAILKEYTVSEETITLGRVDDNTIKIDNMAVSGHHAKLVRQNGDYALVDLNSLNGTFVNGQKVSKWILKHNDLITIGKHTLIFQDDRAQKRSTQSGTTEMKTPEGTVMLDSHTQQQLLEEAASKKAATPKGITELVGALTMISGGEGQNEVDLSKRTTVMGKSRDADIKLKGLFLPNISAVISRRPAGYFISYSEGRAIPKVNGVPVTGQVKLKDGDIIEIAGIKMQFYLKPIQG